ncbi:MAG: STAS domain-containing protein [Rhodospirillales bacterium]|jgi:anti-sigma B factor antagonist|nr:STAS domain-containing protein [Rhodospirillales bacterium]MDP7214752.1 STAS domain-containing protein [Rhodospirillales bacterium]
MRETHNTMKHHIREEGDTIIVAFEDDIDLECSGEARDVLMDCVSRGAAIQVDLSGVSMIDSSGVASLLEAFQNARKKGKTFTLAGVGGSVMRVLKLARLDTVFPFADSVS